MIPELVIGGIALPIIIVALVEFAKALGLSTEHAPYLSGALSVIGYGLVVYVGLVPDAEQYVVYVLHAIILFLTAAGFYDRAQAIFKRYFAK